MKKYSALFALLAALSSGCAIHQKVTPTERFAGREVCIIENPAVKGGFLAAYRNVLTQKGYEVRVLPPTAALNECQIISTYSANWRWDLAMYMAYAEIKVYNQTKPSGEVIYDALKGSANMGKFISAEKKIAELVNQLFVGGAGS
jgi:hypothetical protein